MSTHSQYHQPGDKTCTHHRFKYLNRNYYGMLLFECVRPKCRVRFAIFPRTFWKGESPVKIDPTTKELFNEVPC